MSRVACLDCFKNCIQLHQKNKNSAPKIVRFFKAIMGKDHDKLMYLPPDIAPIMEPLSGKKFMLKDGEDCHWPVLLSTANGFLAFTDGWVPFFRHHNLEERSFLTFEYEEGSDSLFVRAYAKSGSETRNNNSVDVSIHQSCRKIIERVSPNEKSNSADRANQIVLHETVKAVDSDFGTVNAETPLDAVYDEITMPDKILQKECGSRLPALTEQNKTWAVEPFDNLGAKRKNKNCHKRKRPTLEQERHKQGRVLTTPHDNRRNYIELPISAPPIPRMRYNTDSGQVLYLRDPKGRLWPFFNQDKDLRSVKLLPDKWKRFCSGNDITGLDECRFELEDADPAIYRVSVVSRG